MSKLSEAITQARAGGVDIITTYEAFMGFDDLYNFLKEASDNGVTVTFAPIGKP
jgi:hypothetical protein